MFLESPSSKSRYRFVSRFWVFGGPTAYTCAHGFTDICDPADSSNSSDTDRQDLTLSCRKGQYAHLPRNFSRGWVIESRIPGARAELQRPSRVTMTTSFT